MAKRLIPYAGKETPYNEAKRQARRKHLLERIERLAKTVVRTQAEIERLKKLVEKEERR